MKHIEVVAAVIEHEGRILCMQRGAGKQPETAFKFEFPGGKIEAGESRPQALMRELREEMELETRITEADFLLTVEHEYPQFSITMHCYRCRPGTDKFVRREHMSHVWALPEDLPTLDWAPADVPVMRRVMEEKSKVNE